MTGRDDLDELHALAASIADEAHGWRAHRRKRAHDAAQARVEAEMVAPIRRRRLHRWIAGAAVVVVVLVAAGYLVTHRAGRPATAPTRDVVAARHAPSEVKAGQAAAVQLQSLGRLPNLFSCQGWYDEQRLAAVPGQATSAWRAGYLRACADAG